MGGVDMNPTFSSRQRFLPVTALAFIALVACWGAGGASHTNEPAPRPLNVVRIEVPQNPAGAFELAHDALGTLSEATPENTRWIPTAALLATRYMRKRSGPVITDVLIIAAVGRQMTDTLHPTTLVEVSVWTLDTPVGRTAFGASVASTQPMVPRPRPLSPSDSTGWANVYRVVQYMMDSGAKRLP
jgi:hypothetical protein